MRHAMRHAMHHVVQILAVTVLWCSTAFAGERLIIIREPGRPVEAVTEALDTLLDALASSADELEVYFVGDNGKLGEPVPESGWGTALQSWPKKKHRWTHTAVLKRVTATEDIVILAGHGDLFPEFKRKKVKPGGIVLGKAKKQNNVSWLPQYPPLKKVLARVEKLYLLHDTARLPPSWKKGCGKCGAKLFKASEIDDLIEALGITQPVVVIDPDDPKLAEAGPDEHQEETKGELEEGEADLGAPKKKRPTGIVIGTGASKPTAVPPPKKIDPPPNTVAASSGSGRVIIGIIGGILVFALALFIAYPHAYQLRGRLILQDAYGPSKFAEAKLLGTTWRTRQIEVDVPYREGVLVGLRVRRLLHHKRVRVSFVLQYADKLTSEIVAVLEPGDQERYGDLIVSYQPTSAVSG